MSTKIDLDELERKARAADESDRSLSVVDGRDISWWHDESAILTHAGVSTADRSHIAANSPPVTLALIARIRDFDAVSPPSRGVKIQPERLLLVRYFDKECCERRVVALACGYTVVTGTDGFPRVGVEIVIDPRASDHHLACSLSTTQLHRLVIPPRDLLGVRPFRQGDVTDTPEPATPETP